MATKIQLPNGAFFPVKEGESKEQALAVAKQMYPDAFGTREEAKPKQDTTGGKAAFSAGLTRLGGQAELLKGKLGLKSEAEAQKEYEAAQAKAAKRFTPTEDSFAESPFLKFRELLGGSLPSMALPAAAGLAALAAPVSVPVAAGLGLLGAGAASAGQFTASNLGAQVDTGKTLQEASLGKAAAAAVPQALLDTAAMALIPGIGKLFGSVGSKLTTEQAKAIANQTLGKTVLDYTAKTGLTAGREGVTEATQQVLERLQAGLDIADPEARKEYVESFIGGAVLGGTLAPVGRAFERSSAKTQAAKAERDERNLLAKETAEQERLVQEQEELRRQTPAYALEKAKELQALEQEKIALQEQERKVTKNSPTEAEDKAFNKVIQEQLRINKLARDEIAPEVNRLKQTGVYQQALEQERVAGMSPEDYMLEQMSQQTGIQAAGRKTNKGQLFPTEELAPAPADTSLSDYAAEQLTAAQNVGALTTKDRLDYLMQNPEMAKQLLANRTPLPGVDEKEQKTIYSALGLQLKQFDKQQAEQEKQKAAQLERVRGQMAGATPGSELMGAAAQMPAVQAAQQQRVADEARLRVVTPEVEGLQKLGQTPEYSPAQALRQSYETRKASEQQDETLVQGLIDTLPKGGTVTPGQVFQGLGGGTARERSDLLTQLAVAREASGKSKQGGVKDNDVSRGIIEKLRALKQTETTGTGAETQPLQTVLAGISVPEARAKEAAANKFADQQNQQLMAFTRMLGKVNQGTLVLPDTFKQRTDAAKQAYFEYHANEINARRDAFGLPPMAAWERGEARARVMEALNELGDRWGSAANAGPAGQRQFGSQVQAVAALQEQMRTNIQKTVAGAAERARLGTTNEVAEKTGATPTQYYTEDAAGNKKPVELEQPATGKRIAAPAELTLRGEARTEPSTEDTIEALLSQTETRERAVPTATVKPAKKVTDLGDIRQLLEKERSDGKLEPMSAGSINLLQKLQEMLPQTSDAEFKTLAGKIVRQIQTGNEPNLFDVRDLSEMSKGMEAAGQSATRPGVTPEELQRTSAQPQLDLFADKDTQTQRATPRNFQKMLDSGNIQRLRQAIAQLNKDSDNEVSEVEETLTEAQEQLAKAEKITQKALDKVTALEEGADVGSSPLADQSSEALATVKLSDEKLKTRSRVAPETSRFVAEYGLKPTNKADDEIKLAWAEATRDVVAAESALQALPLRIAYLTEIRDSVAKLSKKGKQDLVALIDEALRFSTDPNNPASMRDSLENKEFVELKQWLDPDTANTEIKRLKTVYNLAKRALGPARERVDAAVAAYEEGSVIRKALEREQKKAQDALDKAQRDEQAARAAVKAEQKQETTTEEVGTPNAEYRATLQRAREGLNLPGIRNLVDTTAMKQTIAEIRSAMGSLDGQLENKNLTEEKRAALQASRDNEARKLESVYQDAPRITSEIKENGQLALERAFDDAQAKAYDRQVAKRRKRKGESAPVLPSSKTGPVVKGVRNQRISQSGETSETTATKEAATALEKLAEERATLADLERREKFLRDTGKAKSGGRLTPMFKALQAQITKQKNVVAEAAEEQNKIVAEVRETKQALGKKRIQNVAAETEVGLKGDEASIPKPPKVAFSRGFAAKGLSVEGLQKEIDTALGGAGLTKGRIEIFDTVEEFLNSNSFGDLQYEYNIKQAKAPEASDIPTDAKAFVDPRTGKAFMFANNIDKGDGLGILLHEVGVHLGFKNLFNAGQYKNLVSAVRNWSKLNDNSVEARVAKAALERVKSAQTSKEQFDDELLAYAVEEAIKAGVKPAALDAKGSPIANWLRMVVDTLKRALSAFGINPKNLKAGELVNLAYGAAQLEIRGTWHGSDAKFKAFDTGYAGSGEGAFDLRFLAEESLGAGPYTTPDKKYAEYYQNAVPFGKASNETGYGSKSYQDYRSADAKYMDSDRPYVTPVVDLQHIYENNLLTNYLQDVAQGGELNPQNNKGAKKYLDRLLEQTESNVKEQAATLASREKRKAKPDSIESAREDLRLANNQLKAAQTLELGKIKGLTKRPETGQLYRTLDDVPRERVYAINSTFTVGERPKLDALMKKYGDNRLQDRAKKDGEYEANGLFYNMRRQLGIKKLTEILKAAGIDAIEQKNERGRYTERAFINNAPEIIGVNMEPVGQSEGLLFSRKAVAPANALEALALDITTQPKTLKEKLGNNLALQAEMQAVDMRAGLRDTLKFGDDSLFMQAMYQVRKAEQKMAQMFTVMNSGPLVTYKDSKGFIGYRSSNENSAVDVFDAIADIPVDDPQLKTNIAQAYMVAQRAANKGLSKLDLGELGITEEKLKAAMAAADADPALKNALENVRRKYNAYNKGMIEFLASTQRITKKEADRLLKDGDYVPFYRVRENGTAELSFGNNVTFTVGDIRRQPYLAELKGGETKLLPLNEAIQQNTLLLTDMALTNNAAKSVAYGLQALGKGKGPVDPKTGKPTDLMAIKPGKGPDDVRVIRFYQEPDPNKPDDKGERFIEVNTKGTAAEGIPAELVVQSLEGASLALPGFLKLGGAAADLLRAGVTRTPLYIARKLLREPMAASFTGGLNNNAFSAVFKAGAEFIRMSRGTSDSQAKLIEKGLIQSNIFAGDMSDMKKMALQLASGKDQSVMDKVFAAADRYAMRADAATLALVLKNAEENGLSEVEADLMTMESMNFYKRGLSPTLQYASRLIPFFNAQIQGLNVLVKAARGNMPFEEQQQIKRKFFNNAILLMGTGLVYAMAMDDDETFRNARPRDKYSNFFMPIPGVDEPLKLPIPFEAGYFFSLAVAAVDGMRAETDGKAQFQALRDLFLGSVPGYSSMGVPQMVKPAFEVWSNKNFLTGGNVESLRLQGLDPEERYLATTTELAKQMSKAIPILSPIQIEHLVRGYLGVLPLVAAAGANSLFERESKGEKPTSRASDLPLVGTAFQKKYGGADSDVVFREAKEAEQKRNTLNKMIKEGRREEAIEFRDANRAELALASVAGQYRQVVGRINEDIRRTQERTDLNAQEKRLRLDALDKAKQDRAEAFINQSRRLEERLGS